MRYAKPIFFLSVSLLLLSSQSVFADITEGNSYATSTVVTSGDGDVSVHMESTVNGTTKTLDANQSGTHTLSNSSDDVQIGPSEIPTMTITPTLSPTITPTPSYHHPKMITTFFPKIRNSFHQFIQKLLSAFHI